MQRHPPRAGSSALLSARQRGFSLTEVLVALVFGGVIMLAAMQVYPALRRQSQTTLHYFRLDQQLHQVSAVLEKDLRRAGFCAATCQGNAVTLSQLPGEPANSCIIIAYDFTRGSSGPRNRETFGYRLRAGAIETMVGAQHCSGNGWERLLEPRVVRVTHFAVIARRQPPGSTQPFGSTLYEIQMAARWPKQPEVARQLVRWVTGRNL